MLKYTDDARSRLHDGIKKYSRIVSQARHRGMTERDTADIVKAMLGDMLGFNPFFEVTTESSQRGPYADFAVLHGDSLRFLVVVRSVSSTPDSAQLLRFSGSGAPPYADWILLTNADQWLCYRLGVGPDRHPELVSRVSLLDHMGIEEKSSLFFLLCSEAVSPDTLLKYWEEHRVLSPGRIASILLSEEVLNMIRRELQRNASYRIERHTLYHFLLREVLRPDILQPVENEDDALRLPQCYAYVRDLHDPSTWRLPYRNPDGSANGELLLLASAALEPDGRVSGIPPDDILYVKSRLFDAYLELGISINDIPAILHNGGQ